MGAPTSAVGYTIATTRRENHEFRKIGGGIGKKKNAFPMQQQLHERAPLLRYAYNACFFYALTWLQLYNIRM